MKAKSIRDRSITWESGVAKKAFFVRSLPSIASRAIYFIFSLYWIYRWFVLGASYIFLIMGLFFMLTSFYLLFFPLLYANRQRYIIKRTAEGDVLAVPGFLGRPKEILLSSIENVADISSRLDIKESCRSFEVEYNDGEKEHYELLAVSNPKGLEDMLSNGMTKEKRSKGKMAEAKKPQPATKRSGFEMAMIAGIILLLILIGYSAYTKINANKITEINDEAVPEVSQPFLLAMPKGVIGGGEDVVIGTFAVDAEGEYSIYDCCAHLPKPNMPIEYPYFGNNQTLYLADAITSKPLLEISSEYIKEVYLCLRGGDVPKGDEIVSYFGEEKIEETTCRYNWEDGKCCMMWHAP